MPFCRIDVPDQIGTLSQVGTSVGTNARSFNLAQKVLTWSSRCNFTFHVLFIFRLVRVFSQNLLPGGGYFQIRRSGGLGPHIRFGGKIWGTTSQNKRKNLGSSVTKRRKSWEKVPILGSYLKFREQNLGYLSCIFLEAKFGAPTRISEATVWGQTPRPDDMEVPPPLGIYFRYEGCDICVDLYMIYN